MEIVRDLVTERKLACFHTLSGIPGIDSPIVSLFQKRKRLRHPVIPVDIAVGK